MPKKPEEILRAIKNEGESMTIFILTLIIILIAASFAFAPAPAVPPKAQPPGGEFKIPEGYIVIAPPQKPKATPKPEESFVYVLWNIVMGIVFILVLLSLLLVR